MYPLAVPIYRADKFQAFKIVYGQIFKMSPMKSQKISNDTIQHFKIQ